MIGNGRGHARDGPVIGALDYMSVIALGPMVEHLGATVDLLLVRHEHSVGVTVLWREGDIQIMVGT